MLTLTKEQLEALVGCIEGGVYTIGELYRKSGHIRGVAKMPIGGVEIHFEYGLPDPDPKLPDMHIEAFYQMMRKSFTDHLIDMLYTMAFVDPDTDGPTPLAEMYPDLADKYLS